ncbi:MAG: phosphatidylserine decarboxylase [Clostridia bacterium]|nr:phosphatidylserine decarboxylase [Clostridia bacterium]
MRIEYVNRETGEIEVEQVVGEKYLNWLYTSSVGMGLLELIFKKKVFSYFYGKFQDFSLSKRKIPQFINKYGVNVEELLLKPEEFRNFNEFFYRKLKAGARKIDDRENRLISPADGRLLAYEKIDIDNLIQVKGFTYTLKELIGDGSLAEDFQGGACVVIRLCPIDYHRFHFPATGVPETPKVIKGDYYSVNPLALKTKANIYCKNIREMTIFHSEKFDDLLLVEVGATCVGSIVQTFTPNKLALKGQEKGYFKFGGSTVIIFLKDGKINLDKDLVENTRKGYETKVKMGMGIGTCR